MMEKSQLAKRIKKITSNTKSQYCKRIFKIVQQHFMCVCSFRSLGHLIETLLPCPREEAKEEKIKEMESKYYPLNKCCKDCHYCLDK